MGVFTRTVALGVGLIGAVAGSQLPEFSQQYLQRLGGAVDELRGFVADFERDARATGRAPAEALDHLRAQSDELLRRRGEDTAFRVQRFQDLDQRYQSLREAPPLSRVTTFLTTADPEIRRGVARDFQPAVPVTAEGMVAAGLGFLAGFGSIVATAFGARRVRRKPKPGFEPVKGANTVVK